MFRQTRLWIVVAVTMAAPNVAMLKAGQVPTPVVRQGPSPEDKARLEAFVGALSGERSETLETFTQKEFSPEMLARRTPADRKKLHDQLRKELGAMTLERVMRHNDTLTLTVRGTTGITAHIDLDLAPQPPHQFTRMSIRVTDGPDARDAGPPLPIRGTMSDVELAFAIDSHVSSAAASDSFSGVVVVARHGVPIFEKAYGLASRADQVPNTPATRFNLASVGKAFTRAAVAQLMAAGKLALTDTLGALLPDYTNEQTRAATVEQLLEHQAGIADFFGPTFEAASKSTFRSNADYYRFVSTQPPLFAPGARRQYCNGCYIVLGAIIERLSGQRYEDYIAEHVFARAGMRGAGFLRSDEPLAKVATGYTRRLPGAEGALRSNIFAHGAAGSAAGGSYATAADLLAFDNALREQRLADARMTAWLLAVDRVDGKRAPGAFQIAGGAPGVNTMISSNGAWTVIVVANLDPPAAGRLADPIMAALAS